MSHFWVRDPDENMIVCANCDIYRGSRSSFSSCTAAGHNPDGQLCDGCGVCRDPFDGQLCNWCENELYTLQAEHEAAAR